MQNSLSPFIKPATLLACVLLLAGCGGAASRPTDNTHSELAADTGAHQGFSGSVAHLTSGTGTFFAQQNGADFASDLGNANITVVESSARFISQRSKSADELDDLAYGIYRLRLNPAGDATLGVTWQDSPPSECWLALANWERDKWDLFEFNSQSSLVLTDPKQYADSTNHCFAAVIVLSLDTPVLETIGFKMVEATREGYTLFGPLQSLDSYLIDMDGTIVHTWESNHRPGSNMELSEDGILMRPISVGNPNFLAGGAGGGIEFLDWDSNVIWSYTMSDETQCQHHDFELLPNGNVLLVVWQKYDYEECLQAGRDPSFMAGISVWADSILEIKPNGTDGGEVVWAWYLWDHLVQDFDESLDNYGVVADHPELVDLNFGTNAPDWTHTNAVAYNEELDQLVLSVHSFSEIWIIDHSTTTEEAASHSGGNCGKGGDLLYRWGNPEAYGAGTAVDRRLYYQHDPYWIPDGLEGAGNILIYNNGLFRPEGNYSSIVEITAPVQADGNYRMDGGVWGPTTPAWEYTADPPTSFFSSHISSAQRLPGGNTLICCGNDAWFFEVDPAGEIQWQYTCAESIGGGDVTWTGTVFRCMRYPYGYPGIGPLDEPGVED